MSTGRNTKGRRAIQTQAERETRIEDRIKSSPFTALITLRLDHCPVSDFKPYQRFAAAMLFEMVRAAEAEAATTPDTMSVTQARLTWRENAEDEDVVAQCLESLDIDPDWFRTAFADRLDAIADAARLTLAAERAKVVDLNRFRIRLAEAAQANVATNPSSSASASAFVHRFPLDSRRKYAAQFAMGF